MENQTQDALLAEVPRRVAALTAIVEDGLELLRGGQATPAAVAEAIFDEARKEAEDLQRHQLTLLASLDASGFESPLLAEWQAKTLWAFAVANEILDPVRARAEDLAREQLKTQDDERTKKAGEYVVLAGRRASERIQAIQHAALESGGATDEQEAEINSILRETMLMLVDTSRELADSYCEIKNQIADQIVRQIASDAPE